MRREVLTLTPPLLALLLAACGSPPPRPAESGKTAEAAASASSQPRKPGTVKTKRGGGYYKDDGPGDEIPDNLDEIPDAQPRSEPLHRFANRPYNVLGKSYVPETSVHAFRQSGVASWYGKKFHGQNTSIGEPYDMFAMTAAHPTLAIPSYVRVSNPANGKAVVVRVTDRGPFHADRIIDLSYAAAYRLGYIDVGSTPVVVEAIIPDDATQITYAQVQPPPPPAARPASAASAGGERDEIEQLTLQLAGSEPAPATPAAVKPAQKGLFLQLGAFASADNAESLRLHLMRELDWLNETIEINAGGGMHRVHLGPYTSRADAEKVAERIRLALGYKPGFVTR